MYDLQLEHKLERDLVFADAFSEHLMVEKNSELNSVPGNLIKKKKNVQYQIKHLGLFPMLKI